jgi:AGCS family alanine or glycine:cation symporter
VEGIGKTSRAFGEKIAWFPKLLAIAVLLFAFSTMISWSYYGEQAVIYLCGGPHQSAILIYKLAFCGFVVVGAVASLSNVIRVSDAMLFAMVVPNMIGLYVLLPVVKGELADFRKHVAKIEGKE